MINKISKEKKIEILNLAYKIRVKDILIAKKVKSSVLNYGLCYVIDLACIKLISEYKEGFSYYIAPEYNNEKGLFVIIPELKQFCISNGGNIDNQYYWHNNLTDWKKDIRLKVLKQTIKYLKNESTIK